MLHLFSVLLPFIRLFVYSFIRISLARPPAHACTHPLTHPPAYHLPPGRGGGVSGAGLPDVPDRPPVPQRAHDAVARQHDDYEPAVPQQHQLRLVPRPGTRAPRFRFFFKTKK